MDIVITVGIFISGVILGKFLPKYMEEKGKNLATKEDIEEITQKIENIKSNFLKEEKNLEKKRLSYEQIASALKIFIEGHNNEEEAKEKFYEAYISSWLWASDEVLECLNNFIKSIRNKKNSEDAKKLYTKIILAMRKDVGFSTTKIKEENYEFTTFAPSGLESISSPSDGQITSERL